jgi:lipoprotein-anchoring transpeptidase ErfK/SrfK
VRESPQEPFRRRCVTQCATGVRNTVPRRARHPHSREWRSACRRPARHTLTIAATALTLSLVIAACASSSSHRTSPTTRAASLARLKITPADGSLSAQPQKGIVVTVNDGTLTSVNVETSGDRVTGVLNSAANRWRGRWALNTATRYAISATAMDAAGRSVTATSTFRTLIPHHTFRTQIFEGSGLTYGVGMPVILKFSQAIRNRRAVERSLRLWSSKRVIGAWYWDDSSTLYFRTRHYWPVHTKVRFVAHLDGIEGAPGVYGTHTLRQNFIIGRSLIAVASTHAHHVLIYLDKHLFADWPISTGRPGDDTPNGTYLTIEKQNPAHMKGPGYDLEVPWSVRFTWSGDYVHDAYWSVGQQGFANVSHGCVNLSPEHARTYYQLAAPGDPVTITGSPRGGAWGNGWTLWFLSWRKLLGGSALHKAVRVGPQGSTLVDPKSLPQSKAKPPLGGPKPGNALAG